MDTVPSVELETNRNSLSGSPGSETRARAVGARKSWETVAEPPSSSPQLRDNDMDNARMAAKYLLVRNT